MRDFTLSAFELLCKEFTGNNYRFVSFVDYSSSKISGKLVIMRHDVDKKPQAAMAMAAVEQKLGIRASYYFRNVASGYDEDIIRQIAEMGHEIGYHYEDLALACGNYEKAISSFKENLSKLRHICEVQTMCMHGSPLSKWDNRLLWQRYDYHDFGIIGEPYFDVDFNDVLYLTDTGRCWNGTDCNVRDKVKSDLNFDFRSTWEIAFAAQSSRLPAKVLLNTHPHRWDNKLTPWLKELVWQNAKNIGKRFFRRGATDVH